MKKNTFERKAYGMRKKMKIRAIGVAKIQAQDWLQRSSKHFSPKTLSAIEKFLSRWYASGSTQSDSAVDARRSQTGYLPPRPRRRRNTPTLLDLDGDSVRLARESHLAAPVFEGCLHFFHHLIHRTAL